MLSELSGLEQSEASDASQSPLDDEDSSQFVTTLVEDVLEDEDDLNPPLPPKDGQPLPGISVMASARPSRTVREEVAGATVVTKSKKVPFSGKDVTMAQER